MTKEEKNIKIHTPYSRMNDYCLVYLHFEIEPEKKIYKSFILEDGKTFYQLLQKIHENVIIEKNKDNISVCLENIKSKTDDGGIIEILTGTEFSPRTNTKCSVSNIPFSSLLQFIKIHKNKKDIYEVPILEKNLSWNIIEPIESAKIIEKNKIFPLTQKMRQQNISTPFSKRSGFFVIIFKIFHNKGKYMRYHSIVYEDGVTIDEFMQKLQKEYIKNGGRTQDHVFFESLWRRCSDDGCLYMVDQGS